MRMVEVVRRMVGEDGEGENEGGEDGPNNRNGDHLPRACQALV